MLAFLAMITGKHLCFSLFFIAYGYVVGRAILVKMEFVSLCEEVSWSAVIGWAAAGMLLTALGFAGWFNGHTLSWALALLFTAGLGSLLSAGAMRNLLRRHPQQSRSGDRPLRGSVRTRLILPVRLSAAGLLTYGVILWYASAYPVTAWDAVSYHLPVVKEWLARQWLAPAPSLRFPVHPQFMELFFSPGILLGDAAYANSAVLAMFAALGGLVYSFCRRFFSRAAAALAGAAFFSCPVCARLAVVPYVDIGAGLFFFAGLYALCLWLVKSDRRFGLLGACAWGIAWSIKYNTLLASATFALPLVFLCRKNARRLDIAIFMLIAVLIALPWYARNRILGGDWLFPLFSFDGAFWSSVDLGEQIARLRAAGMGAALKDLLLLPVRLIAHGKQFEGALGALAVLPLFGFLFWRRWPVFLRAFTVGLAGYGIIWFYCFQVSRYLVPVIPVLAVISGAALMRLVCALRVAKRYVYRIILFGLVLLAVSAALEIPRESGPLPVNALRRAEYLARRIPSYRAIEHLNRFADAEATVYALCDEGAVFYYDRRVLGDWFGAYGYRFVLPYLNRPEKLYHVLRGFGARYFLVRRSPPFEESMAGLIQSGHFKFVYQDENAFVLALEQGLIMSLSQNRRAAPEAEGGLKR